MSGSYGTGLAPKGGSINFPGDEGDDAFEDTLHGSVSEQKQLLHAQDEALDDLHEGVLRLGAISSSISSELKEHDTLLDEIEDGVERAHSGMEYVTARTKSIIETASSTGYSWVICTLFAVLVFLIVFALLFKP